MALATGSSRGIGAGIARRFALAGAQVSLNYNATAATEVMNAITTGGSDARLIAGDISNEASVRETIKAVIERFGRIDTLINNAGMRRDRLLLRMMSAGFDDVLPVPEQQSSGLPDGAGVDHGRRADCVTGPGALSLSKLISPSISEKRNARHH